MDIFNAINKRHSYRGPYTETPVSKESLQKIVQAGLQAPSGKNAQTTQFIIINEPELLKKIGELHSMKAMQTAKAMILCVADINPEAIYEGYAFQVEDYAAAVENMLLTITAMGYATVWIDGWLRLNNRAKIIGDFVGLPEGKIIKVLLPLGEPAEEWEQKEKKPFSQRAWFNKYG